MLNRPSLKILFVLILIVTGALNITACGNANQDTADVDQSPSEPISQDAQELPQESESGDVQFEEAELPEDFPPSFPIPEDARISSNVGMGGEDEFRVFISLTTTLEQTLAYYQSELPTRGWSITEEQATDRGTEMVITSAVYQGELLFVDAETGVAVDIHLFPVGTGELIPELPSEFGDSGALGEGSSSFPADFPIPSSYTPIELNDTLRAEGYELAFTYAGIAEMGMVDFNIALMTAGWEIGDMTLEGMSGVYEVPFTDPISGFEGYALITNNPGQFNLDIGGVVLIALAPETP